ncbi:MAG: hypothetical protein VX346_18655 [Planctomycetota bacterium]|nr:hypothetical protein [Planctomycetota bacterium]
MRAGLRWPDSNPFSVRWIDPSRIYFETPPGICLNQLIRQLETKRGWGQIVGPHGSGKTTLVNQLEFQLRRRSMPVVKAVLHRRAWRQGFPQALSATRRRGTRLIVDGFEQLPRILQWVLRWFCLWRGCGLLVTSHRDVGLPWLVQTTSSLAWVQQIVSRLLQSCPGDVIREEDVRVCYYRQEGNLRETLFALYDLFEYRRRRGAGRAGSVPVDSCA